MANGKLIPRLGKEGGNGQAGHVRSDYFSYLLFLVSLAHEQCMIISIKNKKIILENLSNILFNISYYNHAEI